MSEEVKSTEEANTNENEMLELLRQIKQQNSKKLIFQRCITALLVVFILLVGIMVPSVLTTLDTAKTTMTNFNVTIGKMDTAIESINELTDTGSEGLQDALERINSIDIEKLNNAISDLNDVVEPMANFFGRFK